MTPLNKTLAIAATLVVLGATAPEPASASVEGDFKKAINTLVMNLDTEPVSTWDQARKTELVGCIGQVMAKIPQEKKKHIAAASGYPELRARFDEVTAENRYALERSIRKQCIRM